MSWFSDIFRKLFPKKPSYQDAFADAKTPEDVCRIVKRWIVEVPDVSDSWALPEETWKRGYGDCEDFSLIIVEQCRKLNFMCDPYGFWKLRSEHEGHILTVGANWFADMSDYYSDSNFKDAEDMAAEVLDTSVDQLWWAKYDR